MVYISSFFFQAEDGIRDGHVTGVQTCALPISAMNTFGLHRRAVLVKTLLNHHAIATVSGKAIRTPLGMVRYAPRYTTSKTSDSNAPTLSHTKPPTASARENSKGTKLLLIEKYRSEERRVGKEWRSRWTREA